MSRYGKCQNLAGCLLAYRGEEIEVEDGQPFICAECGKPLAAITSPSGMWLKYLYVLAGIAVIAVIAILAFPPLRGLIVKHKDRDATPAPRITDDVSPAPNSAAPDISNAPVAEPPEVVTAPAKIDLDVTKNENKQVKNEVLTRIDLMPNVSAGNKDRLYQSVERARSMGKVLTIPFGSGKTELAGGEVQTLKSELEKPNVAKLREDPTAVFVILGYADPKGDAKKNLAISQTRADMVLKTMREKCEVQNVMHTVAMGGSKLMDAQNLEKNRIVEIWAVLP